MAQYKGTVYTNTGSVLNTVNFYLDTTVNYQTVADNTSNVTLHYYAQATTTNIGTYDLTTGPSTTLSITDNDGSRNVIEKNMPMDFRNRQTVDFGTWTGNVKHNTNGTLNLTINASFNLNFSSAYVHHGNLSATLTLPTIAQATPAPSFSASVESSTYIYLNPADSSFNHRIYLEFGKVSGYLNGSGNLQSSPIDLTSSSPRFRVPSSYYNEFTRTSKTGTITVYTVSGSRVINSEGSSNTFTIRASSSTCQPYYDAKLIDVNPETVAATGDENIIVLGQSTKCRSRRRARPS